MRKLAILLVISLLMRNVSYAFVLREIDVVSEKIIPFNFNSDKMVLEENLNIRRLSGVKIVDKYVDNGEISARINGNRIEVDFDKGELSDNYKYVNKIATEKISASDGNNRKIIIKPEKEAENIYEVFGDFESARILPNKEIEITVKESVEGETKYDKESLLTDTFTVSTKTDNKERKIYSDMISLPYEPVGEIKAITGDISTIQEIDVDGKNIKVLFDKGVPKANENFINSGYTYFWIDRKEDGTFKVYNPNGVYSTDINKVTGKGKYIDEKDFDEVGIKVRDSKWTDFCGIEKDGIRYIYVYDESKGVPDEFNGNLISGDTIYFDEQELNCEKYFVRFSNTDVSYIPEGKLYSMGELVDNTLGWGETIPNRSDESKKTFVNELTGKPETYVKHFKFFYGPTNKKTFGGYYTYPYNCTFKYNYYEPKTVYSGEIIYDYKTQEKINGYSYNGWIKIQYEEKKSVKDYSPTPPTNIRYNLTAKDITWNPGSDDYTETAKLRYEVQIYDGSWKTIENKCFSELKTKFSSDFSEFDVRIRTIDEVDQASDWAYLIKNSILLSGELKPRIVKAGECIDIFANTESEKKIKKVTANNDEMQMYLELQKTKEESPNFFEMSYDVEIDFNNSSANTLKITNGVECLGNKDEIEINKFSVSKNFSKGNVDFEIVEDVKFNREGTLIFSNFNSANIPLEMFNYNSKTWFVTNDNELYIKNKKTGKKELLISVECDTKTGYVGKKDVILPGYSVKINKFEHDDSGIPTYEIVDVDKSLISKPICVSWNTDSNGITSFYVYLGDKVVYMYSAKWEDIEANADSINSIYMYKQMKRFTRASYGYTPPRKTEKEKWNTIVSLAIDRDIRDFLWLGYRVGKNEYVKAEYADEYNLNPNVKNTYRLLIADEFLSKDVIKNYFNMLKNSDTRMTRDKETVWGDDVIRYTSAFQGLDVKVPNETAPGQYIIELTAIDIDDQIAKCYLTLIVEENKKEEESKEDDENADKNPEVVEKFFGRFFYRDGYGHLEELKKTLTSDETEGFICAGETIGFSLVTKNTEFLEVDFCGDNSIKTLDDLTRKFLIDTPNQKGKDTLNLKYNYMNFPKKIYPQYVDNSNYQVYKWFYTVPYKTLQSLESWSSLKDSTLEKIDTSRLFDRKEEPYKLKLSLNGEKELCIPFDVFERWDTVLNRDVTKFVVNSDIRQEMRIDK